MLLAPSKTLRNLADAIVDHFWVRVWPTSPRQPITLTELSFQSWLPAGAYIELPNLSELHVPSAPPSRILTGLGVKLNEAVEVDALLYVEEGRASLIEFAAPLDDFPETVWSFDLLPSHET
jgi:hypothetical protein